MRAWLISFTVFIVCQSNEVTSGVIERRHSMPGIEGLAPGHRRRSGQCTLSTAKALLPSIQFTAYLEVFKVPATVIRAHRPDTTNGGPAKKENLPRAPRVC